MCCQCLLHELQGVMSWLIASSEFVRVGSPTSESVQFVTSVLENNLENEFQVQMEHSSASQFSFLPCQNLVVAFCKLLRCFLPHLYLCKFSFLKVLLLQHFLLKSSLLLPNWHLSGALCDSKERQNHRREGSGFRKMNEFAQSQHFRWHIL